jgi:predicted ribosomally synthesized peptide with nif11-like leader
MSIQTAVEFIKIVQSDEKLRSDVIGLGQDYDALRQLAAKHGYIFTAEELQTAAQTGSYETGQRLNEEELSQVAGGGNQTADRVYDTIGYCGGPSTQWTQVSGCC